MKNNQTKFLILGLALYSTSFMNNKIESQQSRMIASLSSEESVIASPTPIDKVISEMNEIKNDISNKPVELSKKLSDLEKSLDTIAAEKEKIQIEVTSKEDEVLKLQEELNLEKADKEILSEKANALAQVLEQRNKEIGELRQDLSKLDLLKSQLEEIQKQVATLIEENGYLKTENEKLTCMLEKQKDLEDQIKELTKASQGVANVVLTEVKNTKDEKKVEVEEAEEDDIIASKDEMEEEKEELEEEEIKKEEKISRRSNKKREDKELDKSDYLQMYAKYFEMALAKQNEQQQMFQMQILAALQQRGVVTELYNSNVSDQFYNYSANRETAMLAQIERMRLNSFGQRLGLGQLSGQDYLDTNSYFGLNTGRQMNFHQDYIQGQPMIYRSENSYNPQTFNMSDRAYNFNLNSATNFQTDLASYSPMQASSFSIN